MPLTVECNPYIIVEGIIVSGATIIRYQTVLFRSFVLDSIYGKPCSAASSILMLCCRCC